MIFSYFGVTKILMCTCNRFRSLRAVLFCGNSLAMNPREEPGQKHLLHLSRRNLARPASEALALSLARTPRDAQRRPFPNHRRLVVGGVYVSDVAQYIIRQLETENNCKRYCELRSMPLLDPHSSDGQRRSEKNQKQEKERSCEKKTNCQTLLVHIKKCKHLVHKTRP